MKTLFLVLQIFGVQSLLSPLASIKQDIFYQYDKDVLPQEVSVLYFIDAPEPSCLLVEWFSQ